MLSQFQQSVLAFVTEQRDQARRQFHADSEVSINGQLRVASIYAHALYCDLLSRGEVLKMPDMLVRNRGLEPTDPEFFFHLHALDALEAAIAHLS